MEKLPENITKQLKEPLPDVAISPHPTKNYLSTIKAIYVVERLNDVFGVGGWQVANKLVERAEKMIVIKSILTVPEYGITVESYGGNDNQDRGDAYKGACTDALTKIGSYLYIGMDVFKGLSNGDKPAKAQPTKEYTPSDKPLQGEATEKQIDMIHSLLLKKKNVNTKGFDKAFFDELDKERASKTITYLLNQEDAENIDNPKIDEDDNY